MSNQLTPIQIQEAANHQWARVLREKLMEEAPEYHKHLVQEKRVDLFLAKKVLKALDQLESLMDQGLNRLEAQEMIWEELMDLP